MAAVPSWAYLASSRGSASSPIPERKCKLRTNPPAPAKDRLCQRNQCDGMTSAACEFRVVMLSHSLRSACDCAGGLARLLLLAAAGACRMRLYARYPHGTRYLHSDRQQRLDHLGELAAIH